MKLGAINIVMHPHSAQLYVGVLQRARENRTLGNLGRDRVARMAPLTSLPDESKLYKGALNTWIKLDTSKPWFNTDTDDPTDASQIDSIGVPKNMQPGFERIDFYFDAVKHLLVVDVERFSVRSIATALNGLLNQATVNQGNRVTVTVVQDHEALERILNMTFLRRLEITVTRPNGDAHDELEQSVRKEIEKQRIRKQRTVMWGGPEGLKPDERTVATAKIALSNGSVDASGKNADGSPANESTRDHPLHRSVQYDPRSESKDTAYRRAALEFLESMDERPPES